MKELELTNGQYALLDDCDYLTFSMFGWGMTSEGYVSRNTKNRGKQKQVLLHRAILNFPKGVDIDHIDGNRLNNQRSNLRICTHAENGQNRGKPKTNTSGYKGVSWHWNTTDNVWQAQITSNGIKYNLGSFPTPESAARAYDEKAKELHGEFARLNFPKEAA